MTESVPTASEFQRRSWAIQRIGWLAIGAWLLASATGSLGPGPGSRVTTPDRRVSLHYDRVLHLGAPFRLVLAVEREQDGALELALGGAYTEAFEVRGVVPGPRLQSVAPSERRFTLEVDEPGPTRVELALVPLAWGWQTGELRVDGRHVATLRHLVLP